MATATALPKRSEVRVEDTWNLESIYPSVEAWEADFQRVTGMLEGIRAGQGTLGDSAQALLQALNAVTRLVKSSVGSTSSPTCASTRTPPRASIRRWRTASRRWRAS